MLSSSNTNNEIRTKEGIQGSEIVGSHICQLSIVNYFNQPLYKETYGFLTE